MQEKTNNIVDEVWEAAAERLPRFSPAEQRAGLVLLNELSRGEPVSAARLAHAMGVEEAEAAHYLSDSGMSPVVYSSDEGAALGFFGLSTMPTDHRFVVNGRTLWTWCAADTLFLPELLGVTASIESKDPVTGEFVTLTVSPAAVESVEPAGTLVSMNSPDAWETTSAMRLIVTACHFIHFFGSSESGREWTESHPDSVLLPYAEAFAYGKRQNRRMFGTALAERESSAT